jgi:hypothetical protein
VCYPIKRNTSDTDSFSKTSSKNYLLLAKGSFFQHSGC